MNYWIISYNEEIFHLEDMLKTNEVVDWRQFNNFEVGDIVADSTSKCKFTTFFCKSTH